MGCRRRKLLIVLLLGYWAFSLNHLAVLPPVYEDEPWQASTGWKLARDGIFGSDMFAGFYGMERHYYAFMPVHPLLLAAVFKAAGLGLFQARFETVSLGLLLLALTASLGTRLFGAATGTLAVLLMLAARFTALTPSQLTGIVLLDLARIARYDVAATVFGLAALWVYARAGNGAAWRYALAGLWAALASLSHLHGLFWFGALIVLAAWDRIGRRGAAALALGWLAPWLAYGLYVLPGLPDWIGQTREYAPRFGLLDPAWYLANLAAEPQRYAPGGPAWLRPGWWGVILAWPLSILALARQALKRGDERARVLFVPAILLPVCFALLIQIKVSNYLIALLPLGALAVAWGGLRLWRWAGGRRHGGWARASLACLLAAVALEGAGRVAAFEAAARSATPYAEFIGRVRAEIPDGSRVLGLHNYWLGLDDLDYRAWPAPLWQADAAHWSPPLSMGAALDVVAPDVILMDDRMRGYFADAPSADPRPRAALAWMQQHGFALLAVIDDPTYGRMEVYRISP